MVKYRKHRLKVMVWNWRIYSNKIIYKRGVIRMDKAFDDILDSCEWNTIKLVNKGWSNDKKYYIETNQGRHLLLRVSDISQYKNKKRDYEVIKQLDEFDILMSRPIDFGICNNGKEVYTLLTWIDGKDAEAINLGQFLGLFHMDKQKLIRCSDRLKTC